MTNAALSRLPHPWPAFLRDLDSALPRKVTLHCIGGFALIAFYDVPRSTSDIDYIEVTPQEAANEVASIAGSGSDLDKKYGLSLQSVGVADFPEGYESRLREFKLGLRNLKLWVLDPYDLVLSKVARNSPKDRDDAKHLIRQLQLEFTIFYDRWRREMAPWIANKERHELTLQLWKEYFSN